MVANTGEWTEELVNESREWAARDDCCGQYNLGLAYFYGLGGVARDYVQAYMWLTLCAKKYDVGIEVHLEILKSKMTAEEIAEAQRNADAFVPILGV